MDVTQPAVLAQPRPVVGRRSLVIVSLAGLVAIGFFRQRCTSLSHARSDAERHQVHIQVFTAVSAISLESWIAPNVAWCFVAMADPDLVDPMFTDLHIWRVREADFEVGGRRYKVFAGAGSPRRSGFV